MPTVEQLQEQLEKEIAALAEQRRIEAERIEREARLRGEEAAIERQKQIDQYKARQDELHRQKQAQEERIKEQQRDLARQQAEVETAKNAAQEAKEKQEALLEDLKKRIADAEFAAEQHRKRMETLKSKPSDTVADPTRINVEHPEAPVNEKSPGDAVDGTDGLEHGPDMSAHLKQILRQAQR